MSASSYDGVVNTLTHLALVSSLQYATASGGSELVAIYRPCQKKVLTAVKEVHRGASYSAATVLDVVVMALDTRISITLRFALRDLEQLPGSVAGLRA